MNDQRLTCTSGSYWQHPGEVPLPPFSPGLQPLLRSPQQLDKRVRFKMAEVAASFYFQYYDEHLRHPSAYQFIGRRMMEVFPALMAEGPHPWTSFVKAVSDKVRTKRFHARRSQSDGVCVLENTLPGTARSPGTTGLQDREIPDNST